MINVVPEIIPIINKNFLSRVYFARDIYAYPFEACSGACVGGIVGGESGICLEFRASRVIDESPFEMLLVRCVQV